jgi:hypothetical protein
VWENIAGVYLPLALPAFLAGSNTDEMPELEERNRTAMGEAILTGQDLVPFLSQ